MGKKKKEEDRKPIEQEIAELQRKFRVLENDKRACSEDSQATIRKQRATIEKLTRENRKMKVAPCDFDGERLVLVDRPNLANVLAMPIWPSSGHGEAHIPCK